MIEIALTAEDWKAIRSDLIGADTEKAVVLFANQTERSDSTIRLLVRDVHFPTLSNYTRRGFLEAELSPELVALVTKRARGESMALVFVHSHPGSAAPSFSMVDDRGEEHLAQFLERRHPRLGHSALVISEGGVRARLLGKSEEVRVVAVGSTREVLFDPLGAQYPYTEVFDRQIRAFGAEGQRSLSALRVAIVGLGGTGSLVAQQLAHLGVEDFILIDPDVVDATNLNRVVNTSKNDIGRAKINVAADYIRSIQPHTTLSLLQSDVIRAKTAAELRNADLIFGCTDSHGSRAVLQQVAYQYMIPLIDMGVTITVSKGCISHIYGRVQLLSPGLACFACDGLLNPEEVRRDMMTEFERQSDPYIQGAREPAPAVVSLNGTVASLAVTMMLAVVSGIPVSARHILYNAMASTMRSVRAQKNPNCYICSRSGALARGDSWPLFARDA